MTDHAFKTPLYNIHVGEEAKMVEFAGYAMPVQYKEGLAKEHLWTRKSAGLFDVSHMGQAILEGPGAGEFLSYITPTPFAKTPIGNAKYTVLPNQEGGIIDDLIITRLDEDRYFLVLNAGRKQVDMEWLESRKPADLTLIPLPDKALIAIQGPKAEAALQPLIEGDLKEQGYMTLQETFVKGTRQPIYVSRLGYTGEDGFEISIDSDTAADFWLELTANDDVKPAGLGARDTLRLEMGYPLYGHDLNEDTSVIEASLGWVVSKKNDKFVGANRALAERDGNALRKKRVGVRVLDKGVARENTPIFSEAGEPIGLLTSGGFSPTLNESIGQGYVPVAFAQNGTKLWLEVRGRKLAAEVTVLAFVEPKTKTKASKKAA